MHYGLRGAVRLPWEERSETHLSQPRALGSEKLLELMITKSSLEG